jgi:hypothetical protein
MASEHANETQSPGPIAWFMVNRLHRPLQGQCRRDVGRFFLLQKSRELRQAGSCVAGPGLESSESMRIEFFRMSWLNSTACALSAPRSLQPLEGKKRSFFSLKNSTVWAMPKPTMTPEEVEVLTKALQEMHAAEVDVQKAFIEQRPWEERDKAIKKARQTRYAWISLGAKFFTNWPV